MRRCIFCRGRASSREHVWPVWLLDAIGATTDGYINSERGNLPPVSWRGAKAGITVKHVCHDCNTGWMSDLEAIALPILKPLINGDRSDLSLEASLAISSWAVKTAMVLEGTRVGRTWFYSREEHDYFYRENLPPPQTTVWLAQYLGQYGAYSFATDLKGEVAETHAPMQAYVTTLAFRRLVIQVATVHMTVADNIMRVTANMRPGPWAQDGLAIVRTWPDTPESVVWPPPFLLTDTAGVDLETFSDRWGETRLFSA